MFGLTDEKQQQYSQQYVNWHRTIPKSDWPADTDIERHFRPLNFARAKATYGAERIWEINSDIPSLI